MVLGDFLIKIFVSLALIYAVQIPLRKRESRGVRPLCFIVKLIAAVTAALAFIAMRLDMFTYRCGGWLCAVYVALLADCGAGMIEYIAGRVSYRRDESADRGRCRFRALAVLSLIICIAYTAYGVINARTIIRADHEWSVEGLERTHSLAFIADIHAGTAQPVSMLNELVSQINEADPEFVILGGDITDELTSRDDMFETYRIISDIEAPVYFIYGNHDRQPDFHYYGGRTYTDDELAKAMKDADITILRDEYVNLYDDLVLLGREDISAGSGRKSWDELKNRDAEHAALIIADHQPYDDQLRNVSAGLQLSGHTHAGQLWPLQTLYRLTGYQAYGEFTYPDLFLYVSAGESGWKLPFRSEEHCEWDYVTLTPKKDKE